MFNFSNVQVISHQFNRKMLRKNHIEQKNCRRHLMTLKIAIITGIISNVVTTPTKKN